MNKFEHYAKGTIWFDMASWGNDEMVDTYLKFDIGWGFIGRQIPIFSGGR